MRSTHRAVEVLAVENPFEKISPDLSILGPAMNGTWVRVGSAMWAVALLFVALKLIIGVAKMKSAEKRGYAQDASEYTGEAKVAGIALALLVMLTVIVGSVLFVVQPGA